MKNIIVTALLICFGSTYLVSQNVGVGTTTPDEKLHVTDVANSKTRLKVSGGGASPDGAILEHVKGSDQINLYSTKGLFQLGVGLDAGSLDPRIRISPGNGVGIGGVFTPTHPLHLKGPDAFRLEGLLAKTIASDTVLVVDGQGVVKYALKSDLFPSGSGYWSQTTTDDVYYLDSVGIGHNNPISLFDVWSSTDDVDINFGTQKDHTNVIVGAKDLTLQLGQFSGSESGTMLGTIDKAYKGYLFAPQRPFGNPNDQGLIIGNEAAVPIIFATNDEEQMRIDSFGNVGIGTVEPSRKLDVQGTIVAQDSLILEDEKVGVARIGNSVELFSKDSNIRLNPGVNKDINIFGANSVLAWSLFDGSQRRLGINSLLPEKALHVGGSEMLEDSLFFEDEDVVIFRAGNNLEMKSFAHLFLRPNTNGNVYIYEGTDRWSTFEGEERRLGIDELSPQKTLDVGGSGLIQDTLFLGDETERIHNYAGGMKIRSDDNINLTVGSTNNITFNGSIPFARLDANNESMSIGTTVQDKTLHVNGSTMIQDSIFIDDDLTSIHKSGDDLKENAIGDIILNAGGNKSIKIEEDNGQWAVFEGSKRRLGIGTGTPEKGIHVEGSSMISDTSFIGGDNTYLTKSSSNIVMESELANVELRAGGSAKKVEIFADNTQWTTFDGATKRVGINTSIPTQSLEVNGSTLVNDTMYLRNTNNFIGYNNATNSVTIQSGDDIEFRPSGDAVEIYNGAGRYAFFDGSIEQLNLSNSLGNPPLFVNGKSEMVALQVSGGAVPGYVMMSDAVGNAIWSPAPSGSDWTIFGGSSHIVSAVPGNVSIGGTAGPVPPSKLSVEGSLSLPIRTINASDYPYTPSFDEHTIVCLDPGGLIDIPAASAAKNRIYIIKFDATGGQMTPLLASDKIEGVPGPYVVPPGGTINSVTIQSDGVDSWWIIQGNF